MDATSRKVKWLHWRIALLIWVLAAAIYLAIDCSGKGTNGMIDTEFTDRVEDFGTYQGRLSVLFSRQAAQYYVPIERENFAQLVSELAAAWRSKKDVKVAVEQGVEIVAISSL
jgi:hypothetical protein